MNSQKSIALFSIFLLFLSLIRLWDKDFLGFSLFLFFSLLFFISYSLEVRRRIKQEKADERMKVFSGLSAPKIILKKDGNSQITTLIVPSLELFNEINEIKNENRNI
jgi:hypothetical protein